MVRTLSSGLRVRLVALTLLAVVPALGVILYTNVQHHDRAASAARADLRRAALLVEAHHEQVVGSARHLLVALRQTREVSEGGSGCARALREIVRRDARYANLGVVDTSGLLRCSARNHRGVPPDLTGFVGSTLRAGAPEAARFAPEPVTRRPSLLLSSPILDEEGRVRGAMFAAIDLDWLSIAIGGSRLPDGATVTIVDDSGTVLVRLPQQARWVGRRSVDAPLIRTMLAGSATAEVPDLDGVQRLYAFARIGSGERSQGHIAVGIPASAAFAEAHRILAGALIVFGLAALLAIGAAWLGGDVFILRPVRLMERRAAAEERRRVEEERREAEERFRAAFDNAPIGMALTTVEGRYLQANRALGELLGRSPDELLHLSWQDITHPEDISPDEQLRERAIAGEISSYQIEKRYVHREGGLVWALLSVSILRDRGGEPLYFISQIEDITERRAVQERLAHQALHDPLTGMPNRTLFMDRLEVALHRLRRTRGIAAVLFLDLDRFKVVNDSLGHDAGDRVLVAVSERLRTVVRPADTVARFGGDEFVILCEGIAGSAEAETIASRIAEALEIPVELGDGEIVLTASVGIALATGPENPLALLRDADAAMYRAKDRGRARHEIFDDDLRGNAVQRLDTERFLRHALERDEIRLFYEPVVELPTGSVIGVEALVRWQHPTRGLLGPGHFLPVAEETGLIVPLGAWVLDEACRQARAWQELRPEGPPLTVAVNLSGRQLADENLTTQVAAAIDRNDLDPSVLFLEITEGVLMSEAGATVETLRALKELGVRISIDDFGTGYSSLSYLKRFPVDIIKVDRSFVDGLGDDAEDSAIVRAIVTLAHSLGLDAVGEGVETERQLEALRGLGCDAAQGYLWSRPKPPEEIEPLLRASSPAVRPSR